MAFYNVLLSGAFSFIQVPALEHNNEVRGESLDLLKYVDSNFEGPPLLPDVRY